MKNSLEGFNSRFNQGEESVMERNSIEIIQPDGQKGNKRKKKKYRA